MLGVHSPVCSVAHAPLRMLLSLVPARLSPRCRFLQRKSQRASQRDDSHHCIAGIEISELQAHRLDVPGEVCFHRAEPARPAVGLPARRCTGVDVWPAKTVVLGCGAPHSRSKPKKCTPPNWPKPPRASRQTGINGSIATHLQRGTQWHVSWRDIG